jgi:hypothetical protein
MYLKNTYSRRNILRIILNFTKDVQKWCYDVQYTLMSFMGKKLAPGPFSFTVDSDHLSPGEQSKVMSSAGLTQCQSTFWPLDLDPNRLQCVMDPQLDLLSRSFSEEWQGCSFPGQFNTELAKLYQAVWTLWGLLDIRVPTGQQTYIRNTKAHRHFSIFYA